MTLFWEATAQMPDDVIVTLHLIDASGRVRLERAVLPTEGMYPATQWTPGQLVRDQHNIPLPGDLAAGTYHIALEVHTLTTGQQLGSPTTLGKLSLQ